METSAELTITKSSSPDLIIAGKSLTYTIDVRNPGSSDALNVIITETYEANFIFSSSSPSPDKRTTNQWTFEAIRAGDTELDFDSESFKMAISITETGMK